MQLEVRTSPRPAGRDPPRRLALCKPIKQVMCLARHLPLPSNAAEIQARSASIPTTESASNYQNHACVFACGRRRVSARQPRYFLLLRHRIAGRKQVPKEKATRPSASLRCAPGKPASCHSVCAAAQLAARLCRFAQTDGGKSVHDATLSCGSVARSLNRVPQALTHGRIQPACESCGEAGL